MGPETRLAEHRAGDRGGLLGEKRDEIRRQPAARQRAGDVDAIRHRDFRAQRAEQVVGVDLAGGVHQPILGPIAMALRQHVDDLPPCRRARRRISQRLREQCREHVIESQRAALRTARGSAHDRALPHFDYR
jgi:hypothetical protein